MSRAFWLVSSALLLPFIIPVLLFILILCCVSQLFNWIAIKITNLINYVSRL